MKKKNVITAISVIIYTWLFFRETPGINYLIFCTVSIVGMILLNTSIVRRTNWIIVAAGSIITAICVAIYGDGLSVFAFILSEILLVTYSLSERSALIFGWIYPIYSLLGSYIFIIIEFVEKAQKKVTEKTGSWIKILITTGVASIVILFFVLYRESNPLFYNLTKKINLDFISWGFIGFLISGIFIMYSFFNARLVKWLHKWETSGNNLLIQHPDAQNKKYINLENHTGIVLLLLLNAMLLTVNFLDIIYLWGNGGLPEGMTYSTFVHQGTGTLITSILIAITIILFFFRSSLNFFEKNKILKWMVFIWIGQNLFMIFSTAYRNHIYIAEYVLTYKRIGVYIYLILASIGLITTFIKVLKIKSNWYLVRKNSMILYFVLIFACPISWDKIITSYNLSHSKNIDYSYLLTLSDINLPQLLNVKWTENKMLLNPDVTYNLESRNSFSEKIYYYTEAEFNYHLHIKMFKFLQNEIGKNYLSWRYEPSEVYRKIQECNNTGNIKRLFLSNNNIRFLTPLKVISSLEQLYLANNNLKDINELCYFQKLNYLDLSNNQIQYSERMPVLPDLKTLNISNNLLKNLYFLKNLPELETLDISTNNLYNLRGIEKSKKLKSLTYQFSTVQDLQTLKNLSTLESLDLSNAHIISLESFPDLISLKNLKLNNLVNTFDLLKLNEKLNKLQQLISLELSGNNIKIRFLFNSFKFK